MRPFGEEWQDYRTGVIAAAIANVLGDGSKVFMPKDFMPAIGLLFTEEEVEPDIEAMVNKVAMITVAMGGEVSGVENSGDN